MADERAYSVYMVTNFARSVLYIGVTNNLEGRLYEHREGEMKGFTKQYRAYQLVYYEDFVDVRDAIAREKQLKGWTRAKKENLIAKVNPRWDDLSAGWR